MKETRKVKMESEWSKRNIIDYASSVYLNKWLIIYVFLVVISSILAFWTNDVGRWAGTILLFVTIMGIIVLSEVKGRQYWNKVKDMKQPIELEQKPSALDIFRRKKKNA